MLRPARAILCRRAIPVLDWPRYGRADYLLQEQAELRANYYALLKMCDAHLGRVLDWLDAADAWRDTAVILSTDHGLLLGEHEYWGKNRPPFYEEVAHIPLLIHHPDSASQAGSRRRALTQTIDLMPTVLDMFGAACPAEVRGRSLLPVLERDQTVREAALFGQFGGATNVTDGRYTYFRYPSESDSEKLFHYTLMPAHMRTFFEAVELREAALAPPFDWTKGLQTLKVPVVEAAAANMLRRYPLLDARTVLFDVTADPVQAHPVEAPEQEARMVRLLAAAMRAHDAPVEAFARLGLTDWG